MIKLTQCEVCREVSSKYRCPKCQVLYCSVSCFKQHKDSCSPVENQSSAPGPSLDLVTQPTDVEVADLELGEEGEGDRVPQNCLERLGDDPEVKLLLENPHLRSMMTALVQGKDTQHQMEAAMQEPIFSEFADTCLAIIDGDKDG